MAAFKNKANGTWYVQFRYTDWKGERQQKLKRGFATKKEAQAWEREFLMQTMDKAVQGQIPGGQGQRNRYAGQHEQKVGIPARSRRGHRGAITNSKGQACAEKVVQRLAG